MNVIDFHPDELLDREIEGTLSSDERRRLDDHLERCVQCRLERQLRDDFELELRTSDDANDVQTVKAFLEAEAHPGPSLIIAYSQCIAHGIDMAKGMTQQKLAVESGYWPLYRFNPALENEGKNPFVLDSKDPKIPLQDYIYTEGRYRMLQRSDPESAKVLLQQAQESVNHRWKQYKQLAQKA